MPSSKEEIKDILAQRTLTFKRHDGQVFACVFQITSLLKNEIGLFECHVIVHGLGNAKDARATGTDSLSTIVNALELMHVIFRSYQKDGVFFEENDEIKDILPKDYWTE